MAESTEPGNLEDLIQSMERRLARVRLLALFGVLLGAGSLAWALFVQKTNLEQSSLWIGRDPAQRIRAMLGVSNDGVALTMYDSAGQMRLDLGLAPNGVPGLMLLSPHGEPVATVNLAEGRIPTIRLTNVAESTRVQLTPRATGSVLEIKAPGRPDTVIARAPRD